MPIPDWVQGRPLPRAAGSGRERVITEWDSQFAQIGMHLRTIYRDGWVCTMYEKTTRDFGFDMTMLLRATSDASHLPDVRYDGSEGELYKLDEDPLQWRNLWDDARIREDQIRSDRRPPATICRPARSPRLTVESPV